MSGFVSVEIQKNIFQVVAVDFRNKIRVVLDEVYQIGWDFTVIFKGHKDVYIKLFLFLDALFSCCFVLIFCLFKYSIRNLNCINHFSFKQHFDIALILFEVLLMPGTIRNHFNFEASSELSLKVLWSVTLSHDSIFDYANSIPNVVCLLNVLS